MSRPMLVILGGAIAVMASLGGANAHPGQDAAADHRPRAGLMQMAQASAPAQLPGGASSLREAHGDWIVACNAIAKGKSCTVSQQHTDSRSGQRVLAIELGAPAADGGARATLVLPFGLQLDKGVVLQVDEAAASAPFAFKTCLPAGCIVETALTRQVLDAWRKGTNIKLKAFAADTGGEVPLTISLKGLAQAMDRAAALTK